MSSNDKTMNLGLIYYFGSQVLSNLKLHFVENVNGKGLSDNNYSNADKAVVDGIDYMTDNDVTAIINGTYGSNNSNSGSND